MFALLILALALAMDALAVTIARGAAGERRWGAAFETGLVFGVAQGVMPLLGWVLGTLFLGWLAAVDHWIAFALLAFLGVRMMREGIAGEPTVAEPRSRASHLGVLLAAAIATSIDAAAAGLTLDMFGFPVALACVTIGFVTAALCVPAYAFAARLGSRVGPVAEVAGGLALIALGVKILVEHLR